MSGWLFLLQQLSVTACVLLCIASAAQVRFGLLRVTAIALCDALVTLAAVRLPLPLRLMTAIVVSAADVHAAFPGLPKRMRLPVLMCSWGLTGVSASFLRMMAPMSIVSVAMVCLLMRRLPEALPKPGALPKLSTVDVRMGPHRVALTALIDSGNLLRDAVTGLPVVVISRRAARQLGQFPEKPTPGMRLMSVRTVTGTALMTLFRPDTVCIRRKNGWERIDCVIGVSPQGDEGFQALVPACLVADAQVAC